ncbi:FecR family protein [Sphingobacterium sp. E70]|nr:FecR family protein [Sphingobacterium sp. E70]ULT27497.1 FecR family protein [Sphingobacterium sp. E70]
MLTILWHYKPNRSENLPQEFVEKHPAEILPGKNQARLTLYNGEKLEFNKQHTINEKNSIANLNYEKGRLVYGGSSAEETIQWNVLEVPKAGTFEIQLPDGSTVWINANSKLYFPNRFPTDERFVKVEGEAFFKIQKIKTSF